MSRLLYLSLLVASPSIVSCSSDAATIPLISGSVAGQFESKPFTVVNGFALDRSETLKLIGLSNDAISCGSADDSDPPPGTFASIALPSFDVGHYASVLVSVYTSVGGFRSNGSNSGTVEITSSDADSVAGSIAFTYTDEGKTYSLNGTFEVLHCPK